MAQGFLAWVQSQILLGGRLECDCWKGFERNSTVIEFKGSHFEHDAIPWSVRWYVAYPISYRQLEEMMEERGVIREVGVAVSHWRDVAVAVGARPAEILRMANTFEHDDLARARAL